MSYGAFAEYYDLLTSNVNYPGYARRINSLIKQYRPGADSIIELACGTASLGIELSKLGYSVYGVDISPDMIFLAEKRRTDLGLENCLNLWIQDMRDMSLSVRADVVVCSLDALNHLDCLSDIAKTFCSVRRHLKKDGLFIFDMNTPYKHKNILGCNTFVYDLPQVYAVWQNEYRESDCSVGITLVFFAKHGDVYKRDSESFRERAYSQKTIIKALRSCGFELTGLFDELKKSAPTSRTERILYISRRI